MGPDGAYLVVVRPAPGQGTVGLASGSADLFPGALAVTFKDGQQCRPGPAVSCARNGYKTPSFPRVRPRRINVHSVIRRYQRHGKSYADLLVRFSAPVAIANANLSYTLAATLPPACGTVDYQSVGTMI